MPSPFQRPRRIRPSPLHRRVSFECRRSAEPRFPYGGAWAQALQLVREVGFEPTNFALRTRWLGPLAVTPQLNFELRARLALIYAHAKALEGT